MTDPRGRGGALVPLSTASQYNPGEGRIGGPCGAGGGGPRVIQGAELTPEGEKGAEQFAVLFSKSNPRMRCETTSVIFDWAFDGPVNRITQNKDTIVLQYGQLGFTRTIYKSDVIGVADLPYKPDPCKEMGFLDYSKEAKK
jgi:hypothetical protein